MWYALTSQTKKPPILIKNKRQNSDGCMRSTFFVGKFVCIVVLKYLVVRGGSFEALRIPARVSGKAGKRFFYFSHLTETSNLFLFGAFHKEEEFSAFLVLPCRRFFLDERSPLSF